MNKTRVFRKSDIIYHIVKGWKLVFVCTIVGLIVGVTIIGVSYIRGEVSKEYRITTSVAVITAGDGREYKLATPDETDLSTARDLTDSALYVIKSSRNMEAVISELGLKGVSSSDISRNLTVNRNEKTEIIEITLLWRSEKEGLSILQALNRVTTNVMKDTVKMGYLSVINQPKATFIVGGNINLSMWIYAALVGFLIGIGICILKFIFFPTMINEDDITTIFGIDTLGSLPFDRHYARLKPLMKSELSIMDDIKSSAHLLLGHLERADAHKLYVTSTMHDEGKTRLIADVGLQLARLGKKTLIIDCNFANPMLGALFIGGLPYEKTLNALYRGDADRLDAVTRINGCLDLLPCVLERNPENFNDALLAQMKAVMDDYDYVLIDAAPVGTDAEVLRLNEITDTVLYVVRFDHAKVDDIKRAMQRIAKSGIPVVGAVFNCVVNWRQTIINAPKRLANSLNREKKRREKAEKKRTDYRDKREKANNKSLRSHPTEEIALPEEEAIPDLSEMTASSSQEKKREKQEKKREKLEKKREKQEQKEREKREKQEQKEREKREKQEQKEREIREKQEQKKLLSEKKKDKKNGNTDSDPPYDPGSEYEDL